jgi:hypothetical protein
MVLESIKEWLRVEMNTEPLAGLCNELGRRRRLVLAPPRGEGNSEGEGDTIIAASSSDSLQNADNKQLLNCTAPHCTATMASNVEQSAFFQHMRSKGAIIVTGTNAYLVACMLALKSRRSAQVRP